MRGNQGCVGLRIDKRARGWYNADIMANRGKFIVFEGTDGSGKSTQMKMAGKFLKSKGVACILTHEPTDSPFGALLRSCLTGRIDTDERAIAALFAADRLDHISNTVNGIVKLLGEGTTVLCDRFYLSSFAYNGGFVPLEWVIQLNTPAMELLRPDLTIFLDITPEESMRRVARRGETERYETADKQTKIRENYYKLFERFGARENLVIVKSEEEKERTQANVRRAVWSLFGGRNDG